MSTTCFSNIKVGDKVVGKFYVRGHSWISKNMITVPGIKIVCREFEVVEVGMDRFIKQVKIESADWFQYLTKYDLRLGYCGYFNDDHLFHKIIKKKYE